MPATINIVTTQDEVLLVNKVHNIKVAANAIKGENFWNNVGEKYPGMLFKEIRIILDEPIMVSDW